MKRISGIIVAVLLMGLAACSGGAQKETAAEKEVAVEAFEASQPVVNGEFTASRYDITGPNERKGIFDGRVIVAMAPEQSGIYVYENGNRAKVEYTVVLTKPFEKGDSGIYTAVDVNNLPVIIKPDSANYVLAFERSGNNVQITFDPNASKTGSAVEMMERIASVKASKKK